MQDGYYLLKRHRDGFPSKVRIRQTLAGKSAQGRDWPGEHRDERHDERREEQR